MVCRINGNNKPSKQATMKPHVGRRPVTTTRRHAVHCNAGRLCTGPWRLVWWQTGRNGGTEGRYRGGTHTGGWWCSVGSSLHAVHVLYAMCGTTTTTNLNTYDARPYNGCCCAAHCPRVVKRVARQAPRPTTQTALPGGPTPKRAGDGLQRWVAKRERKSGSGIRIQGPTAQAAITTT